MLSFCPFSISYIDDLSKFQTLAISRYMQLLQVVHLKFSCLETGITLD